MDKQICPLCNETLMMSVKGTDSTVEIDFDEHTILFWGDSPARLLCTDECGYVQPGYLRNLRVCKCHQNLVEGQFIAVTGK